MKLWHRFGYRDEVGGEGAAGGGEGGGAPAAVTPAGGESQTLLSGAGGGGQGASSTPTPSWVKDDGSFSDGWLTRLPDGLKDHAALKVLPSITDLAKSYVETKSMVGRKLEAPGENATPEQLSAWRKVLGTPETPEGYLGEAKTLRPESIPETLWDSEGEKAFLGLAHKHNLTPAAVKEIMEFHGKQLTDGLQKNDTDGAAFVAAETSKLKQEWGNEFDANLGLASRMAKTMGLDTNDPMFQNSDVVKAFAKGARLFSETSLVPGEASSASGSITSRISEIQDPKSQAVVAREYRGEFGPERQTQAAEALRGLMKAQSTIKG